MNNTINLSLAFVKNRSEEEKNEDIWQTFIIPPYLETIHIKDQSKSLVIEGGRGSGKTTLIKYFCHATQFSQFRQNISEKDLKHIGLYWRADTNYLNSLYGSELDTNIWLSAFQHLLTCEIGKEIIKSLESLNCNDARINQFGRLETINLSELKSFDPNIPDNLKNLYSYLNGSKRKLSTWLNNIDTEYKQPIFLPLKDFIDSFVEIIKKQLDYISDSTFSVFIDEYENMRVEQQEYINYLVKHSSPGFIYNLAMKKNAWVTKNTTSNEQIQDKNDFNSLNLESFLDSNEYKSFCAQLMFSRLYTYYPNLEEIIGISTSNLSDLNNNSKNNEKKIKEAIINSASKILPKNPENEAAKYILKDQMLRSFLVEKIRDGLKFKNVIDIDPEYFISDKNPETSVVIFCLLYREKENIDILIQDFEKLKSGIINRLHYSSDLIKNNLFGCLNLIFLENQKPSLLYSGFNTIVKMSNGNIRNLLSLFYRIFNRPLEAEKINSYKSIIVSPHDQSILIKEVSINELTKIIGYGKNGSNLYSLTTTLGSYFKTYHRSLRQSETEVNQFTISGIDNDQKIQEIINECIKWSILIENEAKRVKSQGTYINEYMLNPIYSAAFNISYRKMRGCIIQSNDLKIMYEGSKEDRDKLIRLKSNTFDIFSNFQVGLFE
ncbi:MAG: hypothetical protein ACE3JT_02785 [Acinetobacter radioresistens]